MRGKAAICGKARQLDQAGLHTGLQLGECGSVQLLFFGDEPLRADAYVQAKLRPRHVRQRNHLRKNAQAQSESRLLDVDQQAH